jgi:hypothetical protein
MFQRLPHLCPQTSTPVNESREIFSRGVLVNHRLTPKQCIKPLQASHGEPGVDSIIISTCNPRRRTLQIDAFNRIPNLRRLIDQVPKVLSGDLALHSHFLRLLSLTA